MGHAGSAQAAGIVVRFDPRTSAQERADIMAAAGAVEVAAIPGLPAAVVQSGDVDPQRMRRTLAQSPGVRSAGPDGTVHAMAVPNDPGYPSQWGPALIGWDMTWPLADGAGVVIAIVDSGVDQNHPDLVDNLSSGWDFVDGDAVANDPYGHGTHVAGIAAATADNALGVVGLAPAATIMPVRVLNNVGSGTASDVAAGIQYAADNGADIINLSLAGSAHMEIVRDAVVAARDAGILVTCAMGNTYTSAILYPVYDDACFAVGSTTAADAHSSFSTTGDHIDIAAPGSSIYSTTNNDLYGYMNGTSMATPHVSGLGAQLMGLGLDADTARETIARTAEDLGDPGHDHEFGDGRIDADRAVNQPHCTDETVALGTDPFIDIGIPCADPSDATATLQATVTDPPAQGAVDTATPGIMRYTPPGAFTGAVTFSFTAEDDEAYTSAEHEVTVYVTGANAAPSAVADTRAVLEDVPTIANVLANDTDSDGDLDTASLTVLDAPQHGTLQTVGTTYKSLRYTPDPDWYGTDHATYRVCDDAAFCDDAAVTFNVADLNDPPGAGDDAFTVAEDSTNTVDPTTNDVDLDGEFVWDTVVVIEAAEHGATNTHDGWLDYNPHPNFAGTDTLRYRICDNDGACDTAQVTFTVTPINDPPVCTGTSIVLGGGASAAAAPSCSDPDAGDTLTYSISSPPGAGSAVIDPATGMVSYTHDGSPVGSAAVGVTATDAALATSAAATVTFVIAAPPSAPPGVAVAGVGGRSDAVRVSWIAPSDPWGLIAGYRVTLSRVGGSGATTSTVGASSRSRTFSGLQAGATYRATVRAMDNVGQVGAGSSASDALPRVRRNIRGLRWASRGGRRIVRCGLRAGSACNVRRRARVWTRAQTVVGRQHVIARLQVRSGRRWRSVGRWQLRSNGAGEIRAALHRRALRRPGLYRVSLQTPSTAEAFAARTSWVYIRVR